MVSHDLRHPIAVAKGYLELIRTGKEELSTETRSGVEIAEQEMRYLNELVDDVLDLTASENVLGKPVASDLREGKVTMAVIHALERCTPQERAAIETVLRERAFDGVIHREIIAILERYGSLDAATARAMQYATLARNAICSFPDSEIKRALLWAPEFVVAREK